MRYLDAETASALWATLLRRSARWLTAVAGHAGYLACLNGGREETLHALAGTPARLVLTPAGTTVARLADATRQIAAERPGPLLIASPDLPQLSIAHAQAAREDLDDGCDLSIGPASDGGCYLLALARPDPALLARATGWRRDETMLHGIEVASEAGMSMALLRSERELHTPGDARALLADPLAPRDVVEVLKRARLP